MAFNLTNAQYEEFSLLFENILQQQGSMLMPHVNYESVLGTSKSMPQTLVGDAHWILDTGAQTDYTQINYDKRILRPHPFECSFMIDTIDMVMQGGSPPLGQLAQQAANSCGRLIDELILRGHANTGIGGIAGQARSSGADNAIDNLVPLPESQFIPWKNSDLGFAGDDIDGQYKMINRGLNTSKICKAVQMLSSKFAYGPFVCVASSWGMSTLRADPRSANSLFNIQPALATGMNTPYGGVDVFVTSEMVERGKTSKDSTHSAAGHIEYAYVYAKDFVKLGVSMDLKMDAGRDPTHRFNDVVCYQGMYDCVRMQDPAVVVIELNPNLTDA